MSTEHAGSISKFQDLDRQLAIAAQNSVRKKVYETYPNVGATSVRGGELGILRGELAKRRRRWSIRKLFKTIPHLIQALKPCFMVSPLAVSQYLPFSEMPEETLKFDVVIFDEASQVFPEDAIPALLRAEQTILAGDRKQLPPSNFWRRSLEEEPDFDEDMDDSPANQLAGKDSILDVAMILIGRLIYEAHLNVHYRSRDESLIRFSNHYFYDNSLLTFPSPSIRNAWSGVHDVFVPDGRYDAGSTRTNRREAEQVVSLVFNHMYSRPADESLGVVALSRSQADLIEQLIEERRILERSLEGRFTEKCDEPFFVKNLENVQGDERDHIIICVGYGPSVESGKVYNRFGPLNISGGERRLNVVVTRARQRIDLVHSLKASDIHSQQEGGRLLRRYLEYAANPYQAFETSATVDQAAEPESPFEIAVAQALITKGYRIRHQVGTAGYRIDLAILSEDSSKCELGIECDGRTYHSAPAARDRDRLRQEVLERLGWKIHRIWSTAWVRNPEFELSRIEEALAKARACATFSEHLDTISSGSEEADGGHTELEVPGIEITPVEVPEIHLTEYEKASIQSFKLGKELRDETNDTLINIISQVAETEGPVHKDVVIERVRQYYSMGHIRGSTRAKIEKVITNACKISRAICSSGDFIWLRDDQLRRPPRMPVDGNIEHIPPSELKVIILMLVKASFGVPQVDLVVDVARKLGFSRTGDRIEEIIIHAIKELLSKGQLVESFGTLQICADETKLVSDGQVNSNAKGTTWVDKAETKTRPIDSAKHEATRPPIERLRNKTAKSDRRVELLGGKQGDLARDQATNITDKPGVLDHESAYYYKMAQWGRDNKSLSKEDLTFIFSVGNYIYNKWTLTEDQQTRANQIIEKAEQLGFNESDVRLYQSK